MLRLPSAAFSLALFSSAAFPQSQSHPLSIHWDGHGVPYVVADDDAAAIYGQGWAVAEMQFPTLQLHFAKCRGESAKHLAASSSIDDFYVQSDLAAKRLGLPQMASTIYANMDAATKALVDAFAQGIEDYYLQNPTVFASYGHPDLLAEPVTPQSVVAAGLQLYVLSYYIHGKALIDEGASAEMLFSTEHSNEWVVRSDRTTSGKPAHQIDPHILLQGAENLFVSLVGVFGHDLSFVGYNQLGAPLAGVGVKLPRSHVAQDHAIAWTITAGPIDQSDVYVLQMNAAKDKYLFDGQFIAFDTRTITVELPNGNHLLETVKESVHGVVIEERDDLAYCLRFVLDEGSDINAQQRAMLLAKNGDEFVQALDHMAWPGGNMVIATSESAFSEQIRYVLYGPCAQRSPSFDWTQVVDGSTLASLWGPLHTISQFPQVNGASRDHFVNNNVGIDITWSGFVGQSFPYVMIGERRWSTFRQVRAEELLASNLPDFSPIDLENVIHDDYDRSAPVIVSKLTQAYQQFPGAAYDPPGIVPSLLQVLQQWDKRADVDSQEMVLFNYWTNLAPGSITGLFGRPNFVPAAFDAQQAADALTSLYAAYLYSEFLGWPAWGDIHRLHRVTGPGTSVSWPVGGGGQALRAASSNVGSGALSFPVTNGQVCPILSELGTTAATTSVRYTKAVDNGYDFKLPSFDTIESGDWSSASYHALPTTPAQAQAVAVRTESLVYQP